MSDKAQPYVREPRRGESYDAYMTTCMDALDNNRRTERERREICNRQWRERNLMPRKEVVDNFLEALRKKAEVARLALLLKRRFDESQVSRHPAGVTEGGRFAPAGGGGTSRKPAAAKPAKTPFETFTSYGTGSAAYKTHVWNSTAQIPAPVSRMLNASGLKIRADKYISDNIPELRNFTPPGYPPGMTVDAAPGVYFPNWNLIVISEYAKSGSQQTKASDERVTGTVFHEYGHAYDTTLGKSWGLQAASDHAGFIEAYGKDVAFMPAEMRPKLAYYLQEGDRGRKEAFAEIFAHTFGTEGTYGADMRGYFPEVAKWHVQLNQNLEASAPIATAAVTPTPEPKKPEPKKPPAKKPKKKSENETKMQWFFHTDDRNVIRLIARFDHGGALGDFQLDVQRGGNFYGISYDAMREADAGVIEVDENGNAELVDEDEDEEGDDQEDDEKQVEVARLQLLLKRRPFDESQVNRVPAGSPEGGQFGTGGGGATAEKPPAAGNKNAAGASERVSTSVPSKKKQAFDPHQRQDFAPNYATFEKALDTKSFAEGSEKVLDRYSKDFLRKPEIPAGATLKERVKIKAEAFIEQSKSNILALHSEYEQYRDRAKLWYQGANKISQDMSKEYGVSERSVAGVIATLSPQRDWDQNVELSRRVLDIAVKNKDVPFTGVAAQNARNAMLAYRDSQQNELLGFRQQLSGLTKKSEIHAMEKKIKNRENMVGLINKLEANFEGKTLSQLPLVQQPVMLRMYDSGNAPAGRAYQLWNPEGTPSGKVARNNPTAAQRKRGEEGDPRQAGWGGFDSIGNALSVIRDDSRANISASLGDNHKVRNFYNNIVSPQYGVDTTIDTHAIAVSTLKPLGQSSPIVKEGLGMSGPKNAETGLKGMYALHYEAYRRAAAEAGILPREMQSITWEAMRGLYTDVDKRSKDIVGANNAIWKRFLAGDISLEAAQKQILAKGIKAPRWA